MLDVEALTKSYGGALAVDRADLSVPKGQFVGVIGRSGAGKSTLLRLINRLETPTAGSIRCDGLDVARLRGRELRLWRRRCAMIFQQFNLVGRLDVLTNVLLGRLGHAGGALRLCKIWSDADKALALNALEQFDIGAFASRRVDQLSGGQQQRVAICRALLQEPDIILADEPIASLDPRNTKTVMDALLRVNKHFGITVICNLHSLDIARGYCDRLVGMANGRVVFDGAPAALTNAVASDLYGLDASEVMDSTPVEAPGAGSSVLAVA